LGIDLDLLTFDTESMALMVELVAESVIPLDRSKIETGNAIRSELFQKVEEGGKAAFILGEALARHVQAGHSTGKFKEGANSEFYCIVDRDQREATARGRVGRQEIETVLEYLQGARDPGLISLERHRY